MSDQTTKDPVRVAAGLKATLKNPRISEEAKENAQDRLEQMDQGAGVEEVATNTATSGMGGMGHVVAGHKATIKNPNTSEEAKDNSRQFLEEHEDEVEKHKVK